MLKHDAAALTTTISEGTDPMHISYTYLIGIGMKLLELPVNYGNLTLCPVVT